jgi:hypothetical protein
MDKIFIKVAIAVDRAPDEIRYVPIDPEMLVETVPRNRLALTLKNGERLVVRNSVENLTDWRNWIKEDDLPSDAPQ